MSEVERSPGAEPERESVLAGADESKGVSSPYSSGGGGVTLERRVIARYLALLLTGDGAGELGEGRRVLSVAFQQAPAHPVDDVVITAAREGETDPSLVLTIGVRRAPTISSKNPDTKKLFADFVDEMAATAHDTVEHRLGLAVAGWQPHASQLEQLAVLARNQPDPSGFEGLVETDRKIKKPLRERLKQVKDLVSLALTARGSGPDDSVVSQSTWELLSRLFVLMPRVEEPDTLDWDDTVRMLRPFARGNTSEAGRALLERLEVLAGQYGPVAAVIDRAVTAAGYPRTAGVRGDPPRPRVGGAQPPSRPGSLRGARPDRTRQRRGGVYF